MPQCSGASVADMDSNDENTDEPNSEAYLDTHQHNTIQHIHIHIEVKSRSSRVWCRGISREAT